ncbi:MAG: hypothetical protein WCL07_04385 [bacterium]
MRSAESEPQRKSLSFPDLRKPAFYVDLFPRPEDSPSLFDLANKEPAIVIHTPVCILRDKRNLISKRPLTTLLCHGISTADGHVTQNGWVDTRTIYLLTSQYLKDHNLPPIDMFASCDEYGLGRPHPRWDQEITNPVLGIANSKIYWSYGGYLDRELQISYPLDLPNDNPFFDINHPKHKLVLQKFKMNLA